MSFLKCMASLARVAGRELSDEEVATIFERIHKAALDVKAGRTPTKMSAKAAADLNLPGKEGELQGVIERAADQAAGELVHQAIIAERNAKLQMTKLASRLEDMKTMKAAGIGDLEAVRNTIARDYSGQFSVESLEQRVAGQKAYYESKLLPTWDALGNDFLGFFQDRTKLLDLVRELRGEDTKNALAKQGAKVYHDVAEEARVAFNAAGGDVGKLDDWGMPQHHSQVKVAAAGRDAWIDTVLPMLDRERYVDDMGNHFTDSQMREFLSHAWDTIATDGLANIVPGKAAGYGARANAHREHRQIHFKDAQAVIDYWNGFGERTAVEILAGHVGTMARDIAFLEHFGPNPNLTYQTLRDTALRDAAVAAPVKTQQLQGEAVKLDNLYEYAAGRMKPPANLTMVGVADGIANLNVAGKLGGAMLASLFGDKVTMEAVSHMNDLPAMQRWRDEMLLLNPLNTADRRLLQSQGLMLDGVRSGLQRFYEGLGKSNLTGKLANAIMRITGMSAINDIRKGSFGWEMYSAIGNELAAGRSFADLPDSDVRALRNFGINETDWKIWSLADRQTWRGVDNILTPDSIARIPDDALKAAKILGPAEEAAAAEATRRDAIVKLLGVVNTESEFAIVYPGWKERASFYGSLQRGTALGEIARSALQFKSFPWSYMMRGMDLVANQDTPASKAAMVAYLVGATTIAGAMILQTREMLAGKDPRTMADENWFKFWGASFLQGGALGIYGDFLYSVNQTRYGTGPLEALAGPTLGPLLEFGIVQPLTAAKQALDHKETHLAAKMVQDIKGFIPGSNIWYTKAALDHMIWQNVLETLSPGYLATIRSKTQREYGQDWWWRPGEMAPERAPDLEKAIQR